jgi:hypothetical protein
MDAIADWIEQTCEMAWKIFVGVVVAAVAFGIMFLAGLISFLFADRPIPVTSGFGTFLFSTTVDGVRMTATILAALFVPAAAFTSIRLLVRRAMARVRGEW